MINIFGDGITICDIGSICDSPTGYIMMYKLPAVFHWHGVAHTAKKGWDGIFIWKRGPDTCRGTHITMIFVNIVNLCIFKYVLFGRMWSIYYYYEC